MKLNAANDLHAAAWVKYHPPRIQVRVGPWNFTATEAEAVALAAAIAAAVDELRADAGPPDQLHAEPKDRRR